MNFCVFDPNNGWFLINYYCLFHNIGNNWQPDKWYVNYSKVHALNIFSDDEYSGLVAEDGKIVFAPPSQVMFSTSIFYEDNITFDGTKLCNEINGFNNICLDYRDRIVTFVFDESGSVTWTDRNKFRHTIAKRFINKIDGSYPSSLGYKIFKYGGEVVKFLVSADLVEDSPFDSLADSFYDKFLFSDVFNNFAGIRIVRREDGFPANPIDGDIVFDGITSNFHDGQLETDTIYFYTIYTFDKDYNFSEGVNIEVKPNNNDIPRGINTFTSEVLTGSGVIVDSEVESVWHFDEGKGSTVYDFNSNVDLSISETSPIWLNNDDVPVGVSGLRFNGMTTNVSSSVTSSLLLSSNSGTMTIMASINPFDLSSDMTILARQDSINTNYLLYTNSNSGLTLSIGGASISSNNNILIENAYNNIVCTIDLSDGLVSFFVNATPVGSGTLASTITTDSSMNLDIGYDRIGIINRFFGYITEVSIHNVVRSFDYINYQNSVIQDDNGDRLIVFKYVIPDNYNFDNHRVNIIVNEFRIPSYVDDGTNIFASDISDVGEFYTTYRDEFVIGETYYFRFFSENQNGNLSCLKDSMSIEVQIPDIEDKYRENLIDLVYPLEPPVDLSINSGNRKSYIKWFVDLSDDRIKRVRVYRSTNSYPIIDDKSISDGDLVFEDEALNTFFVDRQLTNDISYYYSIVSIDMYRRISNVSHISVIPREGLDEKHIPLLDIKNVGYEIVSGNVINLLWDDVIQIKNIQPYYGQNVIFYLTITDEFGVSINKDYKIETDIKASFTYAEGVGEDVFKTDISLNKPDVNELYTFTVTPIENGLSKGIVVLATDTDLLESIASVDLEIRFKVSLPGSHAFFYRSLPIAVKWRNPLAFEVTNRDNDRVTIITKNKINVLDNQIPSTETVYNGLHARASKRFTARVIIDNKGLAGDSVLNSISAVVYDAIIDWNDSSAVPVRTDISSDVIITNANDLTVKTGKRDIVDQLGLPTGETEDITYVDVSMTTPDQQKSILLYVKILLEGQYSIVKKYFIAYANPLKINIMPCVPLSDGRQIVEQTALVYMVNPDNPTDRSQFTFLPENSLIEWKLLKKENAVDRIFKSKDDTGKIDGIYSYIQNGLAGNVFMGPLNNVRVYGFDDDGNTKYETHTMSVSVFYDGLIATDSQDIELIPLREKGHRVMPSKFLMEFVDFKQRFWTDGIGYATLVISHDPVTSTTKFSESFRECMASLGQTVYKLDHAEMVRIDTNDPDVEIVWGDVAEVFNPYTGRWSLDTFNANIDYRAASVNLSGFDDTFVYFRLKRRYTNQSVTGFEELKTECSALGANQYNKYVHEIVVTGHIVSDFNGQIITLTGGGSLGTGVIPTVLVPEEPLRVRPVGRKIKNTDGTIINKTGLILDGESDNQIILDISFADFIVPEGTKVKINVVNYFEKSVKVRNVTVKTESFVDSDIDPDNIRSYVVVEIEPLQPKKTIAASIFVSVTYDELKKVDRTETICFKIEYDADDWREDISTDFMHTIFSERNDQFNISTGSWNEMAPMNCARGHLNIESVGDKVYAIGGVGIENILGTVEEYSMSDNKWSTKTEMPTPRMGSMSVVIGNYIYIFGGVEYNTESNEVKINRKVERYNSNNDTWLELEDMPSIDVGSVDDVYYGVAFGSAEYISSLNRIYIFSGIRNITGNGSFIEYNDKILYYDIADDSWVYSDTLGDTEFVPYFRISPLSFVDGDSIIVFSGAKQNSNATLEYLVDSYSYNTITEDLNSVNDNFDHMPNPKYQSTKVIIGNDCYILGGFNESSETLRSFDKISKTLNSPSYELSELVNLPKSKNGAGATVVNYGGSDFVVLVGGIESGKKEGFLRIDVVSFENEVRLNGEHNSDIKVTLKDDSGSEDIDAEINVKGYLQDLNALDDAIIKNELFNNNVLLLESTFNILGGSGVTTLTPRSDDIINGLIDTLSYEMGQTPAVRYKVVIQPTITSGGIGGSNAVLTSFYGQTFIGKLNDNAGLSDFGNNVSCIIPVSANMTLSYLYNGMVTDSNVFKLVSAPLYQSDAVSVLCNSKDISIPVMEDLTSSGSVTSHEALDIISSLDDFIPYGASPLYDTLESISTILADEIFINEKKSIYLFADRFPNSSVCSSQTAIDSINAIDSLYEVPVIVNNLCLSFPYILPLYLDSTDNLDLNKISYETGGQSLSAVTDETEDKIVCRLVGELKGSLGYGEATYVIDLCQIVNLNSVSISFALFNNTSGDWRVGVSDNGFEYSPYTIYFQSGEESQFDGLRGRFIRLNVRLNNCFTVTNEVINDGTANNGSPVVSGIDIVYTPVKSDFLFVNEENVENQMQQVSIASDSDNQGQQIKVGISTSGSHNWNDFDTESRLARHNSGKILDLLRDRDIYAVKPGDANLDGKVDLQDFGILKDNWSPDGIDKNWGEGDFTGDGSVGQDDLDLLSANFGEDYSIRSEKLIDIDGYIFDTTYGPWDYESIVTVYDSSDKAIVSSKYEIYPRQGYLVFDTRRYGEHIIRIVNPDKVRVGLNLDNDDSEKTINLFGLGSMYSKSGISDYYLGNTSQVVPVTSIVCNEFPWIACTNPTHTFATVFVDSVDGNSCYNIAHGSYSFDGFLNTAEFVGWWFAKADTNAVVIVIYCKSNEKYYAEVYNRTEDIALYGANPNQCTCIDLDNDKFKDITDEGFCCDTNTGGVLGEFTLDGVEECSFYKVTIKIESTS